MEESPPAENPSAPTQATREGEALPVTVGAELGPAMTTAPAQAPEEAVENDHSELDRTAQGPITVKVEGGAPKLEMSSSQPSPNASQVPQAKAMSRLRARAGRLEGVGLNANPSGGWTRTESLHGTL